MKNIDVKGLDKKSADALSAYVGGFLSKFPDRLVSVVMYGSSVDNNGWNKKSNLNLLFVFSELPINVLKSSLKLIEKGRRKGILAPLFLTEEHIETSMDTFPMEFSEIAARNRVVYGKDIFSTISIDNRNLRLQCEQQIKSLLIKIRQSYLEVGLRRKGLECLLHESFRSVLPIMRSLLVLKNVEVPSAPQEVIKKVCETAGCSVPVFSALLFDKEGDELIDGKASEIFLGEYLEELTKLAVFIDLI